MRPEDGTRALRGLSRRPLVALSVALVLGGVTLGGCETTRQSARPELSRAELQRRCDGEDFAACAALGASIARHAKTSADWTRARELFARSCWSNAMQGCHGLALLYQRGVGGLHKNPRQSLALFTRACDRGWGPSCLALAKERLDSDRSGDVSGAVRLLDRACLLGTVDGCVALVELSADGVWHGRPAANTRQAVRHLRRACDGGDFRACDGLGLALAHGIGTRARARQAAKVFRTACAGGEARACYHLGMVTERRLGPAPKRRGFSSAKRARRRARQDAAEATGLYQKSCVAKVSPACVRLGERATRAGDHAQARQWFARACAQRDPRGCGLLGAAQLRDARSGKARAQALRHLDRACREGYAPSCVRAADVYLRARRPRAHWPQIERLLGQACTLRVARACRDLGVLYGSGFGGTPDRARARLLTERACALGDC